MTELELVQSQEHNDADGCSNKWNVMKKMFSILSENVSNFVPFHIDDVSCKYFEFGRWGCMLFETSFG